MDKPKYRIEIFWSEEDGGYIADVPALRYCSAFGDSYEDALREVLQAMELHLEALREESRPIPEPLVRGEDPLTIVWDLRDAPAYREEVIVTAEAVAEQLQALSEEQFEALAEYQRRHGKLPPPQQDLLDAVQHLRESMDSMFPWLWRGRDRSEKGSGASRS